MSSPTTAGDAPAVYNRKNPFLATVLRQEALTRPGAGKDTRHFVLSLAGGGPRYTPGDSLGVLARNPAALVDEVLAASALDPAARVTDPRGGQAALRQVLTDAYILNRASRKFVTGLPAYLPAGAARDRLTALAADGIRLTEYIDTRDYVDVLREFPEARFSTPEAFLSLLSPIPPRLYSIASSLAAHPDEVHLCVAIVRYETHGRRKSGLCSGFLADVAETGRPTTPVYVQESKSFRLPADRSRDIIMVGPGTGVAPFRAFLEQRAVDGGTGRNWLFFGEQNRATNFFYEAEFTAWQQRGQLHRLDLAFSRDQAQKVYVQHRMREQARELWSWMQGGAHFYVCGDAHRMAKDVHQALIDIAREQGGFSPEAAVEYVEQTLAKTEKRYHRDVY